MDPNVEYPHDSDNAFLESSTNPYAISPRLINVAALSDEEVLSAICCLLSLQGEQGEARFWGATDLRSSAITGPCGIDVAALYYVSYLFTNDWTHGTNIALIDEDGRVNDEADIREAYRAYRHWFDIVERIGLEESREKDLNPLEGTGIDWY